MEDALALVKGLLPKKLQDVLILVLMEDALALVDCDIEEVHKVCVLILVLMEDALAQRSYTKCRFQRSCLNPCFNGRCTRTTI